MTDTWIVAGAGAGVGFLQAMILLVLVGIKKDLQDVWDRLHNHYHEVECGGSDCGRLHTGNVVIPGAVR